LVILGITISIAAAIFEESGKACRATTSRTAAILVGLVHGAGVVTASGGPQLSGALSVDIRSTSYTTSASIRRGAKLHRNIIPFNKRDIVEVHVVVLV